MKTKELFDLFPEAKQAQENKEDWKYIPYDAEGITLFNYDDDEDTWYTTLRDIGFSYIAEDDVFYADLIEWDEGDKDTLDSRPLKTLGEMSDELNNDHDEGYKNYLEWVAENGKDPCDEFCLSPTNREQQTWEITFKRRPDKTIVTNWKQLTGTPIEEDVFPPEAVSTYMAHSMKTRTLSDGTIQAYPSTNHTWEELIDAAKNTKRTGDEWTETRDLHYWTLTVRATLWMTTTNRDYETQLKAAAKKALETEL